MIVDGDGVIDSKSNVVTQPGDVLVAVSRSEIVRDLEKLGVRVELIPDSNGKVDLVSLMSLLASKYEITNVLVEGGGKLAGSLFDLNVEQSILRIVY